MLAEYFVALTQYSENSTSEIEIEHDGIVTFIPIETRVQRKAERVYSYLIQFYTEYQTTLSQKSKKADAVYKTSQKDYDTYITGLQKKEETTSQWQQKFQKLLQENNKLLTTTSSSDIETSLKAIRPELKGYLKDAEVFSKKTEALKKPAYDSLLLTFRQAALTNNDEVKEAVVLSMAVML